MSQLQVTKRNGKTVPIDITRIRKVLQFAFEGLCPETYNQMELEMDSQFQFQDKMKTKDIQKTLIQVAIEKTDIERPQWTFVAAKLLLYDLVKDAGRNRGYKGFRYGNFHDLLKRGTELELYGKYLLKGYSRDEVYELGAHIQPERDNLFNYSGLKLMADRYIVRDKQGNVMELPQERFMVVAMHLAMNEKDRVHWAKQYYDILSNFEYMTATPTLANSGRPLPQLSSCFIGTMGDSAHQIMATSTDAAMVSKYMGGVGIYVGKVRKTNAMIRGERNKSNGVVPFIKILNQVAISFNQQGLRNGAIAIYEDIWSPDILAFMQLKTNNGDERLKAMDIFPAICVPNEFYNVLEERGTWYLIDPHDVRTVKGWSLEDHWGDEWTEKYYECVNDDRIPKIEIPAIEIMKHMLQSQFETGGPFVFNRDTVNEMNPLKAFGMIFSSNLCTEILQLMSENMLVAEELDEKTGEYIIKWKSGNFVVCNLGSVNVSRVNTPEDIWRVVHIAMRMLDSVIDLNFYPVKPAEYTNKKVRPVGLGVMGYHELLAASRIRWESDEHIEFSAKLQEEIAYAAINATVSLAEEKGKCDYSEGSEWEDGKYFERRGMNSERWMATAARAKAHGVRNAYQQAIAPTGSIADIVGTTETTDPIYAKSFTYEKKDGLVKKTAPNISADNIFYYKNAHHIDQMWSIRATAARAKFIDQGNSFNLYVDTSISAKELMNLYVAAARMGVKTIYYLRTQTTDIDECVVCT